MEIDLNCDMGENIGDEGQIMPYITSANIACGFHAGDETSLRATIRLAKQHGVSVGAHPGWRDREGFGRREMWLPSGEVEALVLDQLRALDAIAREDGVRLRHVKPHGALYNQAAKDRALAGAIARAIYKFNPELLLIGLAGSALPGAGEEAGLRVAREGFPDRNYHADGTLVSRRDPNALIEAPDAIAVQAVRLVREGVIVNGRRIPLDTLCLHGDHPQAAETARLVRDVLERSSIQVTAL